MHAQTFDTFLPCIESLCTRMEGGPLNGKRRETSYSDITHSSILFPFFNRSALQTFSAYLGWVAVVVTMHPLSFLARAV